MPAICARHPVKTICQLGVAICGLLPRADFPSLYQLQPLQARVAILTAVRIHRARHDRSNSRVGGLSRQLSGKFGDGQWARETAARDRRRGWGQAWGGPVPLLSRNLIPTWSFSRQMISQRRRTLPSSESSRRNRFGMSTVGSTRNRAPFEERSLIAQSASVFNSNTAIRAD